MRQKLRWGGRAFVVDLMGRDPFQVVINEDDANRTVDKPIALSPGQGRIPLGDGHAPYFVTETPAEVWVTLAGETFCFEKGGALREGEDLHAGFGAPMPGKVTAVKVSAGEEVTAGQVLVVMEAMKMEHRIEAPSDGVVTAVHCTADGLVEQGFNLLDFEPGA